MPKREQIEKRIEIMQAWLAGCTIQYNNISESEDWTDIVGEPSFEFSVNTYRVKPDEFDSINWSHVAEKWNFMARDESGAMFLYENKPAKYSDSWWTGGVGEMTPAEVFASARNGGMPWDTSLISRNAEEVE